MIAAEEWHRYQEDYMRYGLALEPEPRKLPKKTAQKSALKLKNRDKALVLLLIFAVGICLTVMIFLQACASGINYNIYKLNQEIDEMQGDIDNINVVLQSQNNLNEIEEYATNQLMMVYPDSTQQVSLKKLVGTSEVDAYIETLTASERGITAHKDVTVAAAAQKLLSKA